MLLPTPDPAPVLAPLAARWVAWVAAHRQPVNPLKDTTGRHGGRHQPDDVWFLAGTQGGGVARRCVVPAGRPLFFPAICCWRVGRRDDPVPPMPHAEGHAELDGVAVPVHPAGSPASFPVRGFFNNVVTAWPWPVHVSCWGLWGLVPPPAPGTHHLTFGGHDGGPFRVEAEYELVVR